MSKKIRLNSYGDELLLKFINMSNKTEFQRSLQALKAEFPEIIWDCHQQVWRLRLTDAPKLQWFVYRYFGTDVIEFSQHIN